MKNDKFYTIGKTSKICKISIQTLRYYDKIMLIKPSIVDAQNGYRSYSYSDILNIKIVQDLRGLDFSLNEISTILKSKDSSQILEIMQRKQHEIRKKISLFEQNMISVDNRVANMEIQVSKKTQSDSHLELKYIPERKVAYIRKKSACSMEGFIFRFSELFDLLSTFNITPLGHIGAIYYEDLLTFDRELSDIEVFLPVDVKTAEQDFIRIIPEGLYITCIYFGESTEDKCKYNYKVVKEWAKSSDYELCSPPLEEYLVDLINLHNTEDFITEMQILVMKR